MSKLDYLKRYMSKQDDGEHKTNPKKKKKKSSKEKKSCGFRIIDADSIDSLGNSQEKSEKFQDDVDDNTEDTFALAEELPSLAGVIDERAPEIFYRERFTTRGWQSEREIKEEPLSPSGSPERRVHKSKDSLDQGDSDASPPRQRHDSDASPPRRRHDSDGSPPRRRHDSDDSPSRQRHDSDASPPRRRKDSDASPSRRRKDSDASPPRRRRDSDASPPRRRRDSDASPPRRRRDSDASPPRRRRDSDNSPPRKQRRNDLPPPRRQSFKNEDLSPPRLPKSEPGEIKEEPDISPPRNDSSGKTLGGKKAGLQNAKAMKLELQLLKEKERRNFEKLSNDVSGRDAETKIRGRLKEKNEKDKAKNEKEEKLRKELEEKFQKWNKGVKQLEQDQNRIAEVLHEMDKPLARQKDDADLDSYLRDIDRAEDPMLKYIQKKKEQKLKASGANITKYPEYKGPQPPPNRFSIRPGYRWDGLDRSNGFEKRLFDKANQRKVLAEEAMQWSVEDM